MDGVRDLIRVSSNPYGEGGTKRSVVRACIDGLASTPLFIAGSRGDDRSISVVLVDTGRASGEASADPE